MPEMCITPHTLPCGACDVKDSCRCNVVTSFLKRIITNEKDDQCDIERSGKIKLY